MNMMNLRRREQAGETTRRLLTRCLAVALSALVIVGFTGAATAQTGGGGGGSNSGGGSTSSPSTAPGSTSPTAPNTASPSNAPSTPSPPPRLRRGTSLISRATQLPLNRRSKVRR